MGSIGVGTGRLLGSQIKQILNKGETKGGLGTVSDFNSNYKLPSRITIDNDKTGTGVASIAFYTEKRGADGKMHRTYADEDQKVAFLRAVRRRSNVDNTDKAYGKAYNAAKKAGLNEKSALAYAASIGKDTHVSLLNKVLSAGKAKGQFDNIRITIRRRQKAK